MPLKAFEDFAPEPLTFPIGGKTYTVKPVSWQDGLRLLAIMQDEEEMPDRDGQNRLLMGDTYDEMVADNVPQLALSRATLACLIDYRLGREAAVVAWESGIDPKALTAAAGETTQPSTASENPTPSPASTTATTSPKASSKKSAAKGSRSRTPSRKPA